MSFLYLVPTGMNDVNQPGWGSWAGRYGRNETFPDSSYYWANQTDAWHGTTNRDNTLARWAADLQNDFRARLEWCVQNYAHANHAPCVVVNGHSGSGIVRIQVENRRTATTGESVIELSAAGSADPDGDALAYEWSVYPEAGTYRGEVPTIENSQSPRARLRVPVGLGAHELHVILTVRDTGKPALARYRRLMITDLQ